MFATFLACKRFDCFPALYERKWYDENGDEGDTFVCESERASWSYIYTWRGYDINYCAGWPMMYEQCLCGRIHSFNELQAIGWRDAYDPYDQTDRYENWWDEYQEQIDLQNEKEAWIDGLNLQFDMCFPEN
jgi:hypothetical protein